MGRMTHPTPPVETAPVHAKIEQAIEAFKKAVLDPLPVVLQHESATFLVCMNIVAATDALSGWRYGGKLRDEERFVSFVRDYFPARYKERAARLYVFRCRALHNFSPAHFSLIHCDPKLHLELSPLGNEDRYLCASTFLSDFRSTAERFLAEVRTSAERQSVMLDRLENLDRGGGVVVAKG